MCAIIAALSAAALPPARALADEVMVYQDITEIDLASLLDADIVTTKTSSNLLDSPAVITVLDREDLRWWAYSSVSEALQHVVGFYFIDDHVNPNVSVRGVGASLFGDSGTIKVMINGVSVALRPTSGNWMGLEMIPMSAVERIEIIRGPASSLYGADAFLGVVNVITRTPEEGLKAEANGAYGVSDLGAPQWRSQGALTWANDRWRVLAAASGGQLDRSGLRLPSSSPAPRLAVSSDTTADDLKMDSASAFASISYLPATGHEVRLSSRLAYWQRHAEFAPWLQLTAGHAPGFVPTTFRQLQLGAWLDYKGSLSDTLSLTARLGYARGQPVGADKVEVGSDLFWIERTSSHDTLDAAAEASWKPTDALQVLGGVESTTDAERLPSHRCYAKLDSGSLRAGDEVTPCSLQQGSQTFLNVGAYVQARWAAIDHYLTASAGARFDWNSIYASQWSGLAALTSNPTEDLTFKALYSSAFKAPSPLLLYAKPLQTLDVIGNASLKPQFIHTVSGVVSYKLSSYLLLSTIVSYNHLVNKAEFIQQGVNQLAANIAQTDTVNVEVEARLRSTYLSGYLGFEYVRAVRDLGASGYLARLVGGVNPSYPPYQAKLGLSSPLQGLYTRVSVEGVLSAPTQASDANALEAGAPYTVPMTVRLDASVSTEGLRLWDDRLTTASIQMSNLFITGDAAPGFSGIDYPLAPTTWMLSLAQEL